MTTSEGFEEPVAGRRLTGLYDDPVDTLAYVSSNRLLYRLRQLDELHYKLSWRRLDEGEPPAEAHQLEWVNDLHRVLAYHGLVKINPLTMAIGRIMRQTETWVAQTEGSRIYERIPTQTEG